MMFPKLPMCFHPYRTFIPYDLLKVLPFYIGVPKVEALHLHIEKIILGEFQIFFFVWTNQNGSFHAPNKKTWELPI